MPPLFKALASQRTPPAHLFFSQSIHRRRLHPEHGQIHVDLTAMVDLMLDHRSQPLAHAQLDATGRNALRIEIVIRKRPEDGH